MQATHLMGELGTNAMQLQARVDAIDAALLRVGVPTNAADAVRSSAAEHAMRRVRHAWDAIMQVRLQLQNRTIFEESILRFCADGRRSSGCGLSSRALGVQEVERRCSWPTPVNKQLQARNYQRSLVDGQLARTWRTSTLHFAAGSS